MSAAKRKTSFNRLGSQSVNCKKLHKKRNKSLTIPTGWHQLQGDPRENSSVAHDKLIPSFVSVVPSDFRISFILWRPSMGYSCDFRNLSFYPTASYLFFPAMYSHITSCGQLMHSEETLRTHLSHERRTLVSWICNHLHERSRTWTVSIQ